MVRLEIKLKSGKIISKPFSKIININYEGRDPMWSFAELPNYLSESTRGPLIIRTKLFSIGKLNIGFKKYIIPKENIDYINYKTLFVRDKYLNLD